MNHRPMIFDGESVRGIITGNKIMTRRVDSPYYNKYEVGDMLWGKETYVLESTRDSDDPLLKPIGIPFKKHTKIFDWGDTEEYLLIPHYHATENEPHIVTDEQMEDGDDVTKWKSPLFMPRWASRLDLEIVGIRRELLCNMPYYDAYKEGMGLDVSTKNALGWYQNRWDAINRKKAPWSSNPTVVVFEFVDRSEE